MPLTQTQCDELVDHILDLDLVCPEQVADMVLSASNMLEALTILDGCIERDEAEARALGITE